MKSHDFKSQTEQNAQKSNMATPIVVLMRSCQKLDVQFQLCVKPLAYLFSFCEPPPVKLFDFLLHDIFMVI